MWPQVKISHNLNKMQVTMFPAHINPYDVAYVLLNHIICGEITKLYGLQVLHWLLPSCGGIPPHNGQFSGFYEEASNEAFLTFKALNILCH